MNEEKKEKILIYSIIVIVCLIVIFAIIMIWKPMVSKSNNFNKYNDELNYKDTMIEYYKNYISEVLKVTNFDKLYNKLNSEYLDSIGLSDKEQVKEYLKNNNLISMKYQVNNVETYESSDNNNVFLVSYTISGQEKYVNIIESLPYNFTLSFVQSNNLNQLLSDISLDRVIDNVNYDFDIIESTKEQIRIKLTITNNSEQSITYDFSNLNSFQLKYNDNYINMAAIANSSTVNYEILPKSSKSIETLFNLSFANQVNINGARLNNVKINNDTYTIDI